MDETYQTYVNRVARLTLPATYNTQLQNIQESPKFQGGQAIPFPGYSVITPPGGEDSENFAFYNNLEASQQQLLQQLDIGLMIPVSSASFHITLADLIWENYYREAVKENSEFDRQLQERIRESFQQCQQDLAKGNHICWQLLGLMIRPRAIEVCLVPKDEESYERILQLRRSIYQNSSVIALGIEQQYHFTAHITLGYFGEISPNLDRDRLGTTLSAFNDRWLETEPQVLTIHRGELRKFHDMMHYYREPDWPVLEF
ncbi:MAG: DUF1868 domain-containing protein [Xenococcaceae cyanobacterium]